MGKELKDADVLDALEDILDEEREALLRGDLEKVGRLSTRKVDLIDGVLQMSDADQQDLAPLQSKLRRNHELIEQAMAGIRAVTDRIEEIRRVRDSLQTYDRTGRLRETPTPRTQGFEKRA